MSGRDHAIRNSDRSARPAHGKEKVIATFAITILVESAIVTAYAIWRHKPLKHLIVSSLCANLFTQGLLWVALLLFHQRYLLALFITEFCIWGMESAILYLYSYNRLNFREAMFLGLVMNLASFGIGWVLPV
jgi:hypothetical protein